MQKRIETICDTITEVCTYYEVREKAVLTQARIEIKGAHGKTAGGRSSKRSGNRTVEIARQVICYLLHLEGMKVKDIALAVGYRGHSSVVKNIKITKSVASVDAAFKSEIDTIRRRIHPAMPAPGTMHTDASPYNPHTDATDPAPQQDSNSQPVMNTLPASIPVNLKMTA